jgi:peptidoglycan/xylan/chitin deacetylase (PgdA/CDA1 family)
MVHVEDVTIAWGIDDVRPDTYCTASLKLLNDFMETYPVKITFFVTADWVYQPPPNFWKYDYFGIFPRFFRLKSLPSGTLRIDKHREWFNLPQNFAIAAHGLHHFRQARWPATEFNGLGYDESFTRIKAMKELFESIGITPVGFSPPGWAVTDDMLLALKNLGFKYVGGSADTVCKVDELSRSSEAGIKGVSPFCPQEIGGLLNIPRNWDIATSDFERGIRIADNGGIVSLHSHMVADYFGEKLRNGITEENLKRVEKLLRGLENKYKLKFLNFDDILRDHKSG